MPLVVFPPPQETPDLFLERHVAECEGWQCKQGHTGLKCFLFCNLNYFLCGKKKIKTVAVDLLAIFI